MARRLFQRTLTQLRGLQSFDRERASPLIQTGNVSEKLVAAFGARGRSISPTLGDVVHPVAILENLADPSWWEQQVQRTCMARVLVGAIAGEMDVVQLFMAANAGALIRINWIGVMGTVATRFNYGYSNFIENTVESPFFVDRRIPGLPLGLVRAGTDAADQVPNKLGSIQLSSSQVRGETQDLGVILRPLGQDVMDVFAIEAETANQTYVFVLNWTEYVRP